MTEHLIPPPIQDTTAAHVTKPAQAIFGMLIGVWFGSLAKDVLTITPPNPPIIFTHAILKSGFAIIAPVYFAYLAISIKSSLDILYHDSSQLTIGIVIKKNFIKSAGKLLLLIAAFFAVTYWLFFPIINIYNLIFGICVFIGWIVVEMDNLVSRS